MIHSDILIIDDSEICCLMLKDRLNTLGIDAHYILDGKQSIHTIEQVQPKLIILDIFMPEMDGFEIIRELQKQTDTPYIIAISSDPICLEIMMFHGANECYLKNNVESIIQAVNRYHLKHTH